MFATVNYSSCFGLLLLLASSLLDHADAQKSIGDRCATSRGSGACQLLHKCPSVFNDFRSFGKVPEKHCGFEGITPIICCPSVNPSPFQTTVGPPIWEEVATTEVMKRLMNSSANVRVSKQVCTEYEQTFYGDVDINESRRRVTNGTKARAMEFPHMAAVGFDVGSKTRWDCGGTLISDRFVLTAAHCVNSSHGGEAKWVRLGAIVSSEDNVESQFLRIIERIRHPEYRRATKYNDIGLLKLEKSATFNAYVMPACLDTKEYHPAGKRAIATGWRLTDFRDSESRSVNLLKVDFPIVDNDDCASFYSHFKRQLPRGIDEQSQICAGEYGKDTCQGDSGGPLIMKSRKPLTLPSVAGITSFGQACGGAAPGVYTRVYFYLSWIEKLVWPERFV